MIPVPERIDISPTDSFVVTARTTVFIDSNATAQVEAIGDYAANVIASGFGATAQRRGPGPVPDGNIVLALDRSRANLGAEGYELVATKAGVRIVAAEPAGLFYGVQTMRQLLPPAVESPAAMNRRLAMPDVRVRDAPRFEWRGLMLDVVRHFLPASDVKRFIDLMALYKLNRLHLHLSDDQGWRIEIKSWPKLTTVGGPMAIGGARGGFYTQEQYADIVAYAKSRYVTVVPEIELPGHITAALVAYPDLRCDRVTPEPFLRLGGPPNSLCVTRDSVYTFVRDVVGEIVNIAPTPYFHIGGDEVLRMPKGQYDSFIQRAERIVNELGSRTIAWGEAATVNVPSRMIVQSWTKDSSDLHAARGGKVILSPGTRLYLDQKYDSSTVLGHTWAGSVDLEKAYSWDPGAFLPGVGADAILGVEATVFAETLVSRYDYEYMVFPRVIAAAELGWSQPNRLGWAGFRVRLAAHGARLAALGVNFARAPGVSWTW